MHSPPDTTRLLLDAVVGAQVGPHDLHLGARGPELLGAGAEPRVLGVHHPAGVLVLMLSAGCARADSTDAHSVDHAFTTTAGQTVQCTVPGESTVFGTTTGGLRPQAITNAFGISPACAPGYASVLVTFTDTSGKIEHGSAGGFSDGVTWSGDDVSPTAPRFSARHIYRFSDCMADCTVEVDTAPK